jgi:hypothetical protein
VLPTPGDSLAPPRPDRAEPPVSALARIRQERSERPALPPVTALSLAPAEPVPPELPRVFVEPKGCLYALSQPPLMLFLCVVGGLIGAGAVWDLLFV